MKQSRNVGFSEETRQFLHGARADYCIYGDGTITRTWKKSLIEEKSKYIYATAKPLQNAETAS